MNPEMKKDAQKIMGTPIPPIIPYWKESAIQKILTSPTSRNMIKTSGFTSQARAINSLKCCIF